MIFFKLYECHKYDSIERGKQGFNLFLASLRPFRWHIFYNELIVLMSPVKGEPVSKSSHVLKYQFSHKNNAAESGRQLKKLTSFNFDKCHSL